MKNVGCFLAFLCIAAAIPAYADTDLTLFGAAQHQGSLTVKTATAAATTVSTFDPGTFGVFGMRVGHGRIFGGEHTIGYSPRFLEGDTRAVIYSSNILLQAPLPKVKPYGTAGMGFIFSWGTDENGLPSFAKIGNKFALNYGGGVKVLPAGPVGIRFDLRGYLIPGAKFNVPGLSNPLTTVQSQSQDLNIFEAGVGLIFSFRSAN
jgi:opacity protein-like surface antigen